MHAGFGPIRISQTTGSMVSYLDAKAPLHFVTATAAPCTSIFKPIWIDASLPDIGPAPVSTFDSATLFWRHELLHRSTLRDHDHIVSTFADERDALEHEFVVKAFSVRTKDSSARATLSVKCFARADQAEAKWLERVQNAPSKRKWLHSKAWGKFNQEARMSIEAKRNNDR
jgi:secernin